MAIIRIENLKFYKFIYKIFQFIVYFTQDKKLQPIVLHHYPYPFKSIYPNNPVEMRIILPRKLRKFKKELVFMFLT